MKVIIRNLKVNDAEISWKWRNNPEIWKLTGRTWDSLVSKETEQQWISKVINRIDEKRFAICVNDDLQYIGNVQLTNITDTEATYHIFIGEKKYWGQGIATIATKQILKYAFEKLSLEKINLKVLEENKAAIAVYKKIGFKIITNNKNYYLMTFIR